MVRPLQNLPAGERPGLRLAGGGEVPAVDVSNFDAVFRRFAPYVATVARRLLGDEAEVEDVVQDVFVEAHHGLSRVRDAGAVRGWLGRICVRRCVRRIRRQKLWRMLSLESSPDYAEIATPGASPEQAALVANVYRLLEDVGALERVIWILKFVEGESLDEVAMLCACSKSTVQRKLRTAEACLRNHGVLKERSVHG
jgi:RNA polymerase sigma-70 factor, ECF subfamily